MNANKIKDMYCRDCDNFMCKLNGNKPCKDIETINNILKSRDIIKKLYNEKVFTIFEHDEDTIFLVGKNTISISKDMYKVLADIVGE